MAQFLDLPLEILPFILQHIVRPNYLTQLSLVNSHFHEFATPLLYRRAFVYAWHREAKAKVLKLFGTLAAYPRLARYVEQLAIRDFPRALSPTEQDKILDMCLQAIRNCTNLRSCTWTRDGSLSTELLQAFCDVPHLSELEINGHSDRFYDHRILCRFSHLQQITLIMPSSSVVDILPTWVSHCDRLQHLTLICKSSHLLNDSILEEMAPNLVQLRHLYLVGCPKVTSVGLWAVLSANQDGLHGLGLEGLSPDFDIQRLSELCRSSGALRLLQSVTLALGNTKQTRHKNWSSEIPRLLEASPLEMFHVSSLGGEVGVDVSDDLCAAIISDHGHRLKRFSVHRMRVSPVAVEDICHRCVNLEQLFVTMEQDSLDNLGPILSLAPKLKALHIHRPVGMVIGGKGPVVTQEQALRIVKHCTWDLEQIGFNTRVWQIERVPQTQENGVISFVPRLGPYESPEIPEQFLVDIGEINSLIVSDVAISAVLELGLQPPATVLNVVNRSDAMAVIQRPLKGARISTFYPVKSLPPLASLDSAFQLQEYISLLIRLDVHDVEAIVSVPGKFGTKEREGSDDMRGQERDVEKDLKSDVAVDEACWIYEQLRRLAQDLSHPLITTLQQECTRQTCPEMKAGEWLYLCVAHGNDGNMEQCCAIDYILHTLDSATALLNSPRAFPSRLSIPPTSNRHFSSLARRLGRIFAHAYFHHREAFEQAEAESSLYARFLTLTMKFDLVPAEFLFRPSPMSTMHDEHDERDEDPGRGASLQYDSARERDRRQWLNLNDSSSAMDIGLSSGRGLSPPGPAGAARNPSPRKGRNRTDTMVHSEAINVAEELAKDGGFSEADLDRAIAEERMLIVDQGIPEVTVTEPTSVEVYEPGSESQSPTEPPTESVAEAFNVEEHAEVDQQQEEQNPELIPTQREASPELSEEILDIAAPPPAEPSPPESDDEDSPVAEGPVSHTLDNTLAPEVETSEETAAEQTELIEEALQWDEELAETTEALAEEEQLAEETEPIVEEGKGSDGLGSEQEEPRALELEVAETETAGVEVIEQEPRDSPASSSDILEVDVEQAEESEEAVAKEPEAGAGTEESPGSEPSEEAHSSSETIEEDSQNAEETSEEKLSTDPVTQDPPPEES